MAIRVGLLGLNHGAQVHLPAFKANPRYEVMAVCARTPGRAEAVAREHAIPISTADPQAVINSPEIDLVSLATPPATHGELAAAALAAGKHVLVEVGFVPSTPQARGLLALAAQQQRVAAVAFVLRYVPLLRLVSDVLARKALGKPRLMHFELFSNLLVVDRGRWPWVWDANGGGVLAAFVSHMLDLARLWFGPVDAVNASLATLGDAAGPAGHAPADDTGAITLHFASGMLAMLSFSASVAQAHTRLALHGSAASMLIDGWGEHAEVVPMGEAAARPVYPPLEYLEATRGQSGLLGGFGCFLDQLASAVATGQAPPELPTFAAGVEVTRLLDAARLAARQGRQIRLDEVG